MTQLHALPDQFYVDASDGVGFWLGCNLSDPASNFVIWYDHDDDWKPLQFPLQVADVSSIEHAANIIAEEDDKCVTAIKRLPSVDSCPTEIRSDGVQIMYERIEKGRTITWKVWVGGHDYTISEAKRYWTRHQPLHEETWQIINRLKKQATEEV